MMTDLELMDLPYSEFVAGLFTRPLLPDGVTRDLPGMLMHAAIGMTGEAVELVWATSQDNLKEECGDFEFYYFAFYLVAPATEEKITLGDLCHPSHDYEAMSLLVKRCHDVQDQIKKHWVYGKPFSQLKLLAPMADIRTCMEMIYKAKGFTMEQIHRENKQKLLKRYPGGGFTQAAAIARADKPAGE